MYIYLWYSVSKDMSAIYTVDGHIDILVISIAQLVGI